MSQTLAIFHDAYRSLNAKKMFWMVLVISAVVVLAFAMVGINETGVKIAFWQVDSALVNSNFVSQALFYKWIFANIGIGFWLSWIAVILALVSTAGIFPDMITAGSIDLLLSKPIGRLRLFLTQYAAGLLFVTLQVAIFAAASFLVIGLRGGVWEPGLFMAVPLVVCMFSYLFSVSTLIGLLTRSTLAALLLTLLFWFSIYSIGTAENMVLVFKTAAEENVNLMQPPRPPGEDAESTDEDVTEEGGAGQGDEGSGRTLQTVHRILFAAKTVLPKTTETMSLLERSLIDMAELPRNPDDNRHDRAQRAVGRKVAEEVRSRSVGWVVGTSLGFELVVLALAAAVFCRRDY